MNLIERFKNAWNLFSQARDPTFEWTKDIGPSTSTRSDPVKLTGGNDRSIVTAVMTKIAVDCSMADFNHVELDEEGRFSSVIKSSLNRCLTLEANIDQTGRSMMLDAVLTMLDIGHVVFVPTVTDKNIYSNDDFEIMEIRIGRVVSWHPDYVRIRLYNSKTGQQDEVTLPKRAVAIVQNPFFAIMNEPNSTAKRLSRKLALMDLADEKKVSKKLNLILQLPYLAKSKARTDHAEKRMKELEEQLGKSEYGIGYTDGTEKVIQLGHPLDNQLLETVDNLKKTLYAQLGITEEVMNGTADEKVMNNYYKRTVEPILTAIVDEMKRKFLSEIAREEYSESIQCYYNPFRLVPTSELAELVDKLCRNEVVTANEFRQAMGLKPSTDPKADMLYNSNNASANPDLQGQYMQEVPEDEDY